MPDRDNLPNVAAAVGEAIRQARLSAGLTQQALAERAAGIEPNYVGRIERGEKNISVALLVAVARALNTTPADLLRGVR